MARKQCSQHRPTEACVIGAVTCFPAASWLHCSCSLLGCSCLAVCPSWAPGAFQPALTLITFWNLFSSWALGLVGTRSMVLSPGVTVSRPWHIPSGTTPGQSWPDSLASDIGCHVSWHDPPHSHGPSCDFIPGCCIHQHILTV